MKNIIFLVISLFVSVVAMAAGPMESSKDLELLYFNHGDSVSLRWAPMKESVFRKSATFGYIVQRRKLGETEWKAISKPLFPMSNEKMEVNEAFNEYYEAIREIIYHKGRDTAKYVSQKATGISSVKGEKSLEDELLIAMALYSCDFSVEAARAAAVLFVDKSIVKGEKYQYRVILGSQIKQANPNVAVCDVNTSELSVLPKMDDFTAEFREWDVYFSWPVDKHVGYYSGYMVERSTDSIHFEPVKDRPIIHSYTEESLANKVSFIDSVPDQDQVYYYRMKGLSPFGFWGPTSKVVKGQAKFNFNLINVRIDTVIYGKKKEYADIIWTVGKEYEKKIKGFRVQRTSDFNTFTFLNDDLIPAGKRKFRDPKIARHNYYSIVVYGHKEGQITSSSFYYGHRSDTIPPATPTGLKAEIDSAGIAHISWNKNKEEDMMAYRLYFSNTGRENDYFDVTERYYKDTFYVDTLNLNTLTNNIYYKVLAVDKSYNHSPRSKAVKAVKPDTVAPVGVVFDFLTQDSKGVVVKWENSPSEDFAYMELYRQVDDTGKVELVKRFDSKKKRPVKYVDETLEPAVKVQYFMYVYDEAGNMTKSRTDRMTTSGERIGCISKVEHMVVNTEKKKEIRLAWDRTDKSPISRYVIYRKEDDGRMLAVASVRANELFYVDKEVAIGSSYVYIVRAISTERVCPAVYTDPIEFAGTVK